MRRPPLGCCWAWQQPRGDQQTLQSPRCSSCMSPPATPPPTLNWSSVPTSKPLPSWVQAFCTWALATGGRSFLPSAIFCEHHSQILSKDLPHHNSLVEEFAHCHASQPSCPSGCNPGCRPPVHGLLPQVVGRFGRIQSYKSAIICGHQWCHHSQTLSKDLLHLSIPADIFAHLLVHCYASLQHLIDQLLTGDK